MHVLQVLLGLFIVGFSMCIYFPAFMSYLSIVKQKEAGTASSGQNTIIFVTSGVLVFVGSAITHTVGLGWYMTALAALDLVALVLSQGQIQLAKAHQKQLLHQTTMISTASHVGGSTAGGQGDSPTDGHADAVVDVQ
jgi:MFS family permease